MHQVSKTKRFIFIGVLLLVCLVVSSARARSVASIGISAGGVINYPKVLLEENFDKSISFADLENIDVSTWGYWRVWYEAKHDLGLVPGVDGGLASVSTEKVISGVSSLRLEAPHNAPHDKTEVSIDFAEPPYPSLKVKYKIKVIFPPYRSGTWAGDWCEFMLTPAYTENGLYYEGRVGIYPSAPGEQWSSVIRIHTPGGYSYNMKDFAQHTFVEGHTYEIELAVDFETKKYVSLKITDLTTGETWVFDTALDGMPLSAHSIVEIGPCSQYSKRDNSMLFYTWLRSGSSSPIVSVAYVDDAVVAA